MDTAPKTPLKAGHRKRMPLSQAILFMGILLLCASCALPAGGLPGSTPKAAATVRIETPTAGPSHAVVLQNITMIDAKTGWATTNDAARVLRTGDGAISWRDVTPSTGRKEYTLGAATFLDANSAWIAVNANNQVSVFHTFNAGGVWVETPIINPDNKGATIRQITFSDTRNGWLVFSKGVSAHSEDIAIFRTNDGGASWLSTASSNPEAGKLQGQLPSKGEKNGITFLNVSIGWLTGTLTEANKPWFYMSQDGGSTWEEQGLALPATKGIITTLPPTFFGREAGVLPVQFLSGDTHQVALYTTSDGGKNWKSTEPTADLAGPFSFVDAEHAWGANGSSIAMTSDGGQHWSQVAEQLAAKVKSVARLDFVSASEGWALASTETNSMILYHTIDSGKTWQAVETAAS